MGYTYYDGTEDTYPLAITTPDDAASWNATNLALAPQGLADRTTTLMARASQAACSDWSPGVDANTLLSGSSFVAPPAFDPFYGRWVTVVWSSPSGAHASVVDSIDGGATWITQVGTLAPITSPGPAVIASQGNAFVFDPAANTIYQINTANSVISTVLTSSGTMATGYVHPANGAQHFYSIRQVGPTFDSGGIVTRSGSTWTQYPITAPSNWVGGINNCGLLLSAVGPGIAVVAMCGVTPGVDTPRLLQVGINPTVFMTDTTSAASSALSGCIITGIAYNALEQLWGLMVYNGTRSDLFTSPDAFTWTHAGGPIFTGKCIGLACLGKAWVTAVPWPVAAQYTTYRYMVSTNVAEAVAASRWRWCNGRLANVLQVLSSGAQLLAYSAAHVATSRSVQAL